MMKIVTVISALALMLTSGLEALTIASPVDRSTYEIGQAMDVLVVNNNEESFVSASVTFASACGNLVTTIPIGTTQRMYLPCEITGETIVSAVAGSSHAKNVHIQVNPVYSANIPLVPGAGCGYPYAAGVGCGAPCGPMPCPPRPSCRRNRRGCGYYAEEAVEVAEFNAQQE